MSYLIRISELMLKFFYNHLSYFMQGDQQYVESYKVHCLLGDGGQAKYPFLYLVFISAVRMTSSMLSRFICQEPANKLHSKLKLNSSANSTTHISSILSIVTSKEMSSQPISLLKKNLLLFWNLQKVDNSLTSFPNKVNSNQKFAE